MGTTHTVGIYKYRQKIILQMDLNIESKYKVRKRSKQKQKANIKELVAFGVSHFSFYSTFSISLQQLEALDLSFNYTMEVL